MYSPLLYEMLAQSKNDEVAAAAEHRRAVAERAEFRPVDEAGLVRFAKLLISGVAYEIQRALLAVRGLAGDHSTAISSGD